MGQLSLVSMNTTTWGTSLTCVYEYHHKGHLSLVTINTTTWGRADGT